MNWKSTTLSQLCFIEMGGTPDRANLEYWNGNNIWVSIADLTRLENHTIKSSREMISDAGVENSSVFPVEPGTLLLSFKLSIGKRAFAGVPLYTNEAIAALPIKNETEIDPLFLYYALGAVDWEKHGQRAVMGITINKGILSQIPICYPPLDEQKRIAAILEEADHARRTRRFTQSLSDVFLQETFMDMFGDPVTNPMGWERAKIAKLGKVVTGNTPSREKPKYYGDFIEWIKSDNILDGQMYLTRSRERLSEIGLKVGRYVEPGSSLVTCIAGSLDSIGSVAFVDRRVAFNQQINAVTPHDDIHPLFLYGLLLFSKPIIQRNATSSMKRIITKSKFEQIELFKPPYHVQEQFAYILDEFDRSHRQQQESERQAEHLFQTLLHRAFQGEL